MQGLTLRASLLVSAMAVMGSQPALAAAQSEANASAPQDISAAPANQSQEASALQEITVTARRTNESLQKVPIAVTVLSNELLKKNNIVDSYGLLQQIPGVANITRNVGNPSTALLFKVRGVAPVAYYFNEAPMPLAQSMLVAPFFDLSNVQVLKGPQGTLFGQASNAGALINTPRRPGEDFGGYVQASVGNYDFKSLEGALDIPLVKEKLLLRVAGVAYSREAYIRDAISDLPVEGALRYEVGRATLVWRPSDSFESTSVFQVEMVHDQSGGAAGTPGDYNMFDNSLNRTIAAVNGMDLPQLLAARDQILANQRALGPYRTQGWSVGCPATAISPATSSTVPGPNVSAVIPQACPPGGGWFHSYAAYNISTWNIADDITIKNIVSRLWGRMKYQVRFDNDGTRLIGNEANTRNAAYSNPMPSSWSEELQLQGKMGALEFTLGGFFYDERPFNQKNPVFGNFTTSTAQSAAQNFTHNRSYAVYGQGNYDLSSLLEGLKVTAGARYTWDSAYRRQIVLLPVPSRNGGKGDPTGEAHWDYLTYTASAQYQISQRTMVYFNHAKGSSSGGLQNNVRAPKFDPDSLSNFEIGAKTVVNLGDLTMRINGAAYYGKYNNAKVSTVQLAPSSPNSPNLVLVNTTANAAAAKIKGFELEVASSFGRLFDLNAFVSHDSPHFTRFAFTNPLTRQPVNLKDQPFALAPKWKFGISPTFHVPVDEKVGKISIGAVVSYRSQMWVNPVKPIIPNDPANPDTGAICKARRTAANGYGPLSADGKWAYKDCAPSFYNVNFNINWQDVLDNPGLRLGLTITNLTANAGPSGLNSQYDTLNAVGYQPNEPRMIYATLGYSF